jgi:hypothetical protein
LLNASLVVCESGTAPGVVANVGIHTGSDGTSLSHSVSVLPSHAVFREAAFTIERAKQCSAFLVLQPCGLDVGQQLLFRVVMQWHFIRMSSQRHTPT